MISQTGGIERFKGFAKANTTQTPDDLLDRFLTELTHAELKILLYIIRRTYGFEKDSDHISLKQISEGIVTPEVSGGERRADSFRYPTSSGISASVAPGGAGVEPAPQLSEEDGTAAFLYGLPKVVKTSVRFDVLPVLAWTKKG